MMGRPSPRVPIDVKPIRVVERSASNPSMTRPDFSRPSYASTAIVTELHFYPAVALVGAVFVILQRAACKFDTRIFKIDRNTKGAASSTLTMLTMASCSQNGITRYSVANRATKTPAFVYFSHISNSTLPFATISLG